MSRRQRRGISIVATALFLLAATGSSEAAFSDQAIKCRDAIAKSGSKLAKVAAKDLERCHKRRAAGSLPPTTDCNSVEEVDMAKGKIGKVGDKLVAKTLKRCSALVPADLLYTGCPNPCDAEVPSIGSFQDVADCVVCMVEDGIEVMTVSAQGNPATPMESADASCHASIGKSQGKYLKTLLKERTKCQKGAEQDGEMTTASCQAADPKNKISKALDKGRATLDDDCADADLFNLDSCSDISLNNLKSCVFNNVDAQGTRIFRSFYVLAPGGGITTTTFPVSTTTSTTTTLVGVQDPQCPNLGELTLYAGVGQSCANNGDCPIGECDLGIGRCRTVTDLDTGYTGIAHDADIDDLVVTRGTLLCPGPAPTCGQCTVTGIDPSTRSCRCANDNQVYCFNPFQIDNDTCDGAMCNCYLGTPLPLSAGNTPACAVNRFGQDITGTANVDTGDGTLDVRLRSVVYLGSFLAAPCPVCGGTCTAPAGKVGQACALDRHCDDTPGDGVCGNYDPTVNDGVRGGTCYLGEDQGMDCDVEALNTTFPANGGGGYSLDCFPVSGTNVSGAGLRINLLQTTGSQSLTANIDCGFPPNFVTECHCSQCTGDETIPCRNNTDCGGAGTCALVGQGIPIPHQCSSLADECMDVGGGEGVCPNGPTDSFCDGFVRANGEGLISCSSNTTCEATSAEFPSGTGLCTLTKTRPCFLETITAEGMADPNAPIGAAIFCIAQTGSDGINSVAGLPGPGRVINQATSRTFCASDNNVEYMPGVGGCPP